jgi:hypothetical protein
MTESIRRLVRLFAARSTDRSTLDVLLDMLDDTGSWQGAHRLFDNIRGKT